MPDESFTASSYMGIEFRPSNARLDPEEGEEIRYGARYGRSIELDHDGGAWCAAKSDGGPWISVDLGEVDTVDAIDILGRKNVDHFVTSFELLYSLNCESWEVYKENGEEKVSFCSF